MQCALQWMFAVSLLCSLLPNFASADIESKFKAMCNAYGMTQNNQAAVLWIGDDDYSGASNKFVKNNFDDGDYFVAAKYEKPSSDDGGPPKKKPKVEKPNILHTEVAILEKANDVLKNYNDKKGNKPDIFLFTKNSPCCGPVAGVANAENCPNGCSSDIAEWMTKNKGKTGTMTVAWDQNYQTQGSQNVQVFLYSLNTMLSAANVHIHWNDDGYCKSKKAKKSWFQREMFNCIEGKADKSICTSSGDFKKDLVKAVNRIVWLCGTRDKNDLTVTTKDKGASGDSKALDAVCLGDKMGDVIKTPKDDDKKKKAPKDDDRKKKVDTLKDTVKTCAEKAKSNSVGPALDPDDPTKWSNSAKDVKGNYNIDNLCFNK